MSVSIRMQRLGRPNKPYYRMVAVDKRSKRNGMPIEVLGSYNPKSTDVKVTYNKERLEYWLKQGAQPSELVASLTKAK